MTTPSNPIEDAELAVNTPTADASDQNPTGNGSGYPERQPDPLELLLGIDGTSIPSNEPIVVCIDNAVSDTYLGIVETIAKRLYRERVGGTPTALRLTDVDELLDETRWIEAEDAVTTIALSPGEWDTLEMEYEDEWRRIWSNRIQNQLFTQEFGVIILNHQVMAPPGDHFPMIYQVSPSLPTPSEQHRIGRVAAGFSNERERGTIPNRFETFAQRFNHWQECRQRETWHEIASEQNGLFWDATTPDDAESQLHRRLKMFALRTIARHVPRDWSKDGSVRELRGIAETERTLTTASGGTIRADVYCDSFPGSATLAIEAETLFGTDRDGGSPRDKLRQTIEKYDGVNTVDDLVVIVDPLTIITQGSTITNLAQTLEREPITPALWFATIDFATGQIRAIQSLCRKWDAALGETEPSSLQPSAERDRAPEIIRW